MQDFLIGHFQMDHSPQCPIGVFDERVHLTKLYEPVSRSRYASVVHVLYLRNPTQVPRLVMSIVVLPIDLQFSVFWNAKVFHYPNRGFVWPRKVELDATPPI